MKNFALVVFIFSSLIIPITSFSFNEINAGKVLNDEKDEFVRLEHRALQIITYHCGVCHTPGLKTSNPRALKVYDLSEGENWWKKLTRSRLMKSRTMLSNRTSATKAELEENFFGSKFKARSPTPEELHLYSQFIDAVLATGD
jgi:hypothetical protein